MYIVIAIIIIIILISKNKNEFIATFTQSLSLNRDRQVGKRGNVPYYVQTDLSGFVINQEAEDLNFQVNQNQQVTVGD